MQLTTLRSVLAEHPGLGVRLVLQDGRAIAPHFHVTEVGRVEKQFVDCGGARRSSVVCVLQTLVAHDTDHRLTTDKLANIVALADSLGLNPETSVVVEHQERSVSVDDVVHAEARDGVLEFRLAPRQTACLAEDACGLGLAPNGTLLPVVNDCCDPSRPC